MTQAEQAYQVLQKLLGSEPPTNEKFEDWTLRCMEAISGKIDALELEVSKLKVKNGTGKN